MISGRRYAPGKEQKRQRMKKENPWKKAIRCGIFLTALGLCGGILILLKIFNLNQYLLPKERLCGVDVSHYQGEIDWKTLGGQDIDFAFIKATEGSGHLDERFAENWQAAEEAGIYIGAYHFFSFDSAGDTQADWYIQNVGALNGKLAPVVDIEYYGEKEANPPEREKTVREICAFLQTLEEYYQIRPIIYTTYSVYRRYIKDEFDEYPLWIRNVYYHPDWDMKGKWQFWQYMDRAVLDGYTGEERYIDLNVFHGTEEELKEYLGQEAGI